MPCGARVVGAGKPVWDHKSESGQGRAGRAREGTEGIQGDLAAYWGATRAPAHGLPGAAAARGSPASEGRVETGSGVPTLPEPSYYPPMRVNTACGSILAWARNAVADCTRICAVVYSAISLPKSVSRMALSDAARFSRATAMLRA